MAYPVAWKSWSTDGNLSATAPVELPAAVQATGDFMVVIAANDGGGTAHAMAGWTEIATPSNNNSSSRCSVWIQEHTGSDITTPTLTGANDDWNGVSILIRDADTSTFVDSFSKTNQTTNTSTPVIPSVTTTTDNCLVLRILALDGNQACALDEGYGRLIDIVRRQDNASAELIVSYETQTTAGATGTVEYTRSGIDGGTLISIAITNKSGGGTAAKVSGEPDVIQNWAFNTEETITNLSTIVSTINGISVSALTTIAQTTLTSYLADLAFYGPFVNINMTPNGTTSIQGVYHDIASTDMSVKPYSVTIAFPESVSSIGNAGPYLYFEDSSGNWVAWRPLTEAEFGNQLFKTLIAIMPSQTFADSSGTIDWTDIVRVGYALEFLASSTTQRAMRISLECMINPVVVTGGSAGSPATGRTIVSALKSGMAYARAGSQGAGQNLISHSIQIGDGVTPTYFTSKAESLEFPQDGSASLTGYFLKPNEREVRILASDNDVIEFSSGILRTIDAQDIIIDPASSLLATYSFLNTPIVGYNIEWKSGIDCTSAAFLACGLIDIKSSRFESCIFESSIDTTKAVLCSDGAEIIDCSFIKGFETYAIEMPDVGGVYDLSGTTFTGYTTELNVTAATGTTTITLSTGQAQPTYSSAGATVTFVQPVNTLTINSDTAATLIRYFTDDSQTIVDSATGTTLDYVWSVSDPIDIELVKQSYVPINRQNVTPIDGDYSVEMDFDESYNDSHGLTITSEYDYNRATKVLTVNSDQNALDVRSSLADVIRTNSAYYNTRLLMVSIPGLTRVDLTNGMTIASMSTWKGAGMERFDAADPNNPVEKWYAIKSVGTITGATTHYRQTSSGDSTAVTLTSNVVDEAFQYWSDPNHDGSTADGYDYSGYMVVKSFLLGSKQGRVDVVANAGVAALKSNLYTVPLTNESHDYAGTDPGISADLTLIAGGTFGGKTFAYEIVDGGTNSGTDIADQFNYNAATNPNTVIPGGTGLRYFELPDMVIYNASSVESARGYREGATPALVGFYVSRSSADHPDFTRLQADDGTYYVPAVTSNITVTGMPAAGNRIRLQLTNETAKTASAWAATTAYSIGDKVLRSTGAGTENTAGLYFVATTAGTTAGTEPTWSTTPGGTTADGTVVWTTYKILYYDDDPVSSGYSNSYTNGEEFITGDTYGYRFAELDTSTSFKIASGTGVVSSTGFTIAVSVTADAVYASNAIDGSATAITDIYTADYTNSEIDLDANLDFTNPKSFAFYCQELTTSQGMYQIWGGVTAIDAGNYRNNVDIVSILFDETAGFVKQEDSDTSRWFRSDGTRPFKDPTTGGAGISMNWKNPVYTISTGSVLTAGQQVELSQAAQAAAVNTKIGTPAADVSTDIAAIKSVADATLADTDELQTDWADGGRLDLILDNASTFDPAVDVLENSKTYRSQLRVMYSALAGKAVKSGSTETFRDDADSKDRITATTDENGQRTSVTTDGS